MTRNLTYLLLIGVALGLTHAGCADGPGPQDAWSTDVAQPPTDALALQSESGSLPPVASVERAGPFSVTTDQRGGANSWVFRPTELGKDGVRHPVFVFGNGATMTPGLYAPAMQLIASHGIIVVQPTNPFVTPSDLKTALDWILGENDRAGSIFQGKLSGKAAMGGHSLGSLGTFDVEAKETRLSTTVHVAGGSFDGLGSSKVKTPTAYICGAPGASGNVLSPNADLAQPQCESDFARATQPTFYTSMRGVGHIPAVGRAAPAIVAWLRWHLAGETERKEMFTGPDGVFFQGIFNSKTKNW